MPLTRLRRRRVEGRKGRCGARHSHLLRAVSMDGSRNAYAERFVRTIKESCLERMIFFGEDSLRNATTISSHMITPRGTIKGSEIGSSFQSKVSRKTQGLSAGANGWTAC